MQIRKFVGAGFLTLALSAGFTNPALAEPLSPDEAASAADAAVESEGAAPAGTPAGLTVDLPSSGNPQASARGNDGSTITLKSLAPVQSVSPVDGKSVATLSAPSSSIVTEPVSDGLRSLIVINSADAPTRFDFELVLPQGITARKVPDGSILLEQDAGEGITATVGKVESPWAKDANGADVATHLELNGGILTQVVDHRGVAYPVTADPKLTYGWGVYLNLWGWEANGIRYGMGGAIAGLTHYGCSWAGLPSGYPGKAIKLACNAGGNAAAISFLNVLARAQGLYNGNWCYQTRIVPSNGVFVPVAGNNCE